MSEINVKFDSNYMKHQRNKIRKLEKGRLILAVNFIIAIIAFIIILSLFIGQQSQMNDIRENQETLLTMIEEKNVLIDEQQKQIQTKMTNEELSDKIEGIEEIIVQNESRGAQRVPVVASQTSFKSYMDYRAITSRSSPQWRLQQDAWTDDQGLRRYNDDYVIALGSYYGSVGARYEIELTSGRIFTATKGDSKSDIHTGIDNKIDINNGSTIEFIVDTHKLQIDARQAGSISVLDFEGTIKNIKYL